MNDMRVSKLVSIDITNFDGCCSLMLGLDLV